MADRKISALGAISAASPAGFQLTDLLAAARPGDSTNYKMDGTELLTFMNDNAGSFVNAFKTIAVAGQTDVVADSGADTLTLVGVGLTLTTTAGSDTVTWTVDGASIAETNTGTSTVKFVTPDALAGSKIGTKLITFQWSDPAAVLVTGDNQAFVRIPPAMAGMDIVSVHARVDTAPSGGTVTLQLHNTTSGADILSTALTIDSGETGSDTAATPAVINASEDDLTLNDIIRLDVDAVNGAKGLFFSAECRLP